MNWDSLSKVKEWPADMPVLFVTGSQDSFVPSEMTDRLFNAMASTKKQKWVVQGGDHNNTWQLAGAQYFEKVREFIKSAETKAAPSVRLQEVTSEN